MALHLFFGFFILNKMVYGIHNISLTVSFMPVAETYVCSFPACRYCWNASYSPCFAQNLQELDIFMIFAPLSNIFESGKIVKELLG